MSAVDMTPVKAETVATPVDVEVAKASDRSMVWRRAVVEVTGIPLVLLLAYGLVLVLAVPAWLIAMVVAIVVPIVAIIAFGIGRRS